MPNIQMQLSILRRPKLYQDFSHEIRPTFNAIEYSAANITNEVKKAHFVTFLDAIIQMHGMASSGALPTYLANDEKARTAGTKYRPENF